MFDCQDLNTLSPDPKANAVPLEPELLHAYILVQHECKLTQSNWNKVTYVFSFCDVSVSTTWH